MSPVRFDQEELMGKLYDYGPTLRAVVIRFNELPDEEAAERMGSFYKYLRDIDPEEVSDSISKARSSYAKLPGIAKNIAGIGSNTDKKIKRLFDNTELMVVALATRFYTDNIPKKVEFRSEEEHQEWVQKFRQYLGEELSLIIGIYPDIRDSKPIMGRLRKRLKEYDRESLLDELPTVKDLEQSKNKIMSIYNLFEQRESDKYT